MEGYPIGSFWGYKAVGVFQNDEQLASLPHISGTRVGELIFEDVNGDKVIDTNDYVYLGSYTRKYSWLQKADSSSARGSRL